MLSLFLRMVMATDGAVDRGEPKGVADDVVHPSVTGAEDGSCV